LCFNAPWTPEVYSRSLHDALPICRMRPQEQPRPRTEFETDDTMPPPPQMPQPPTIRRGTEPHREPEVGEWDDDFGFSNDPPRRPDRKSTRLNSSHVKISYAVFCLK